MTTETVQALNAAPLMPATKRASLWLAIFTVLLGLTQRPIVGAEAEAPTAPPAETPPTPAPDPELYGLPIVDPPAQATEEPKVETPPVAEVAPAEDPPVEPVPPPEPEKPAKILPNRIAVAQFNDIEQEAIALRKSFEAAGEPVPSMKERIELVEARRARQTPQPSVPDFVQEREAAETELAEVEGKLDEYAENESLFNKDVKQLFDRKAKLERQIDQASRKAGEFEAQQVQSIRDAHAESKAEAIALYPSAAYKESPLGQTILALAAEIKADPQHPDRGILSSNSAPELVASRAATILARQIAQEKGISVSKALQSLMATEAASNGAKPATPTKKVALASGTQSTQPNQPAKPAIPNLASPESFKREFFDDLYNGSRSFHLNV